MGVLLMVIVLAVGYLAGIARARRFYRPKLDEAFDEGARTAVRRLGAL